MFGRVLDVRYYHCFFMKWVFEYTFNSIQKRVSVNKGVSGNFSSIHYSGENECGRIFSFNEISRFSYGGEL